METLITQKQNTYYTKMDTADNQGYYSCYLLKVVTNKWRLLKPKLQSN